MTVRDMLGAAGGSDGSLYVDDVFSAFTYTGNGATQTINNGIDLAGKGGLVWIKDSSRTSNHKLIDTVRGNNVLASNLTTNNTGELTLPTWLANGFSIPGYVLANDEGVTYVSWTFRKAPRFFDIVTYTGDGLNMYDRWIGHSLGTIPGLVLIKRTDQSSHWFTWFRASDTTVTYSMYLNSTSASSAFLNLSAHLTTSTFRPTETANVSGATYVAYLFAHDPSVDGLVRTGSYTGNGSSNGPTINLGWEPQYVLIKRVDQAGSWELFDTSRGITTGGDTDSVLYADAQSAQASGNYLSVNATGFQLTNTNWSDNWTAGDYIYLAIRRPNKPPTTGTQVYNAIARTGTGAAATVTGVGFAPDWVLSRRRNGYSQFEQARLRGQTYLQMDAVSTDIASSATIVSYDMDGITVGSDIDFNGSQLIQHFFKRAPGVFDVVCWTGDGLTNLIPHSLGVKPELVIFKQRNSISNWEVGVLTSTTDYALRLNMTNAADSGATNTISVGTTSSVFSSTLYTPFYSTGNAFIAYLFATKLGISKVGSYTGNGSTQTIDCGFTTGARFVLIKRTDSTGDWYVWDSTRGIVAGNDPHLSLNISVAEVTSDDSIDPDSTGFIVNQVSATNINVSAATYIYLAIA